MTYTVSSGTLNSTIPYYQTEDSTSVSTHFFVSDVMWPEKLEEVDNWERGVYIIYLLQSL